MADVTFPGTSAAARRPRLALPLASAERAGSLVLALGVVGGLAAADGGYFPSAWGWAALALLWLAALALLAGSSGIASRLEGAWLASLGGLVAWTAASIAWSDSPAQTLLEVERALVYLAGVAAALTALRDAAAARFLGLVLLSVTGVAGYALATRFFPDRLGHFYDDIGAYRLGEPLGYWNALGIFAVLGVLLAVGFAARAERIGGRALAAASLPILTCTLYFTFSRGAWIALALGLAGALVLDRRRLQLATTLLVVVPAPGLAVWLASRSDALTTRTPVLADASREGHRLAVLIALLTVLALAAGAACAAAGRRVAVGRGVRRVYGGVLLFALAGILTVVFVRFGSPPVLVEKAYQQFTAPTAPARATGDLNARLFSFWGNGRPQLWRVAWEDAERHRVLGSGAGTYESRWLAHRPIQLKVRDAHSLYVEMLAELGPIGLGLLLLVLGVPVAAALRARRHPLLPAAFGAYLAYLVHAGVDWDWEMPAVTLTAILVGATILLAARGGEPSPMLTRVRYALLGGVVVLAAAAFVGLVGNMALAESADAARRGDWATSIAEARKAERWAPWSPEPWRRLGEAQLAQGDVAASRASFRTALDKAPREWRLWLDLARAAGGRERQEALARAAKLNPLSPEIRQLRLELASEPLLEVSR